MTSPVLAPAWEPLAGQVALVTGAARGLGRGVAVALAEAGAHVVAVDVDTLGLSGLLAELSEQRCTTLTCDVTDREAVRQTVAAAAEVHERIDILANVAGVVVYGDTDSLSFEDWDRVIGINLTASWLVSKEALPHLRKTQGSIIHTASVQGFASQPLVVAYTASKGGVVALTKAMAIDHAPSGIRVNCVCPGSVRTPMLRQGAELFSPEDPEGAMNEWGRKHPLGRLLEPEDVAPTYVFLASHLARAITGVALPVDGGLIARLAV